METLYDKVLKSVELMQPDVVSDNTIRMIGLSIHPYSVDHRIIRYERGGKVVKRKVPLKAAELHYQVSYTLEVKGHLKLKGMYMDEHVQLFLCTERLHIDADKTVSILQSYRRYISTDDLKIPTRLFHLPGPLMHGKAPDLTDVGNG